jgi:hypothetical protein
MVVHPSLASELEEAIVAQLGRLAPRPQTPMDTGLGQTFLADLVAKHLLEGGVLTMSALVERLALAGKVLDQILHFLRQESRVEVLPPSPEGLLRYRLTDRGRSTALDAMMRSGYVGPAPVPLHHYVKIVHSQTVHDRAVTKSALEGAFEGVVLKDGLLDQLGPSLNSGRAIFIYGPAGTGKTYIAQKLRRVFRDRTLIPHAIAVNEAVVEVFDPIVHRAISRRDAGQLVLDGGHDPRYVCCERPFILAGGELSTDMLEIQYDFSRRVYRTPLQLKANNGMLMIDDMGRQKSPPEAIFNRWIVPMEEKKDYLSLGGGRHFSVPFDVVLVFSTNMNPLELADEAFLRRIGYKIEFEYLSGQQYRRIWQDVCTEYGIVYDPALVDFVTDLHKRRGVGLLPCHPRDLLGMAVDLATYLGEPRVLTKDQLQWAWDNYFVSLKDTERLPDDRTKSY